MDKVKKLIRAGASLSGAVREVLGERSLASIAEHHGVSRQNLTSGLNGGRALTDREITVLIAELGGTEEEWRRLLADAARRRIEA